MRVAVHEYAVGLYTQPMPRPDPRAPQEGQESLFAEAIPRARPGQLVRGRHSTAVDGALDAARAAELIRPEHEGLATFVRHAAWTADMIEHQQRPTAKASATLVSAVSEAVRELGLTPAAAADETNEALLSLLDQIATPTSDYGDTEIPH